MFFFPRLQWRQIFVASTIRSADSDVVHDKNKLSGSQRSSSENQPPDDSLIQRIARGDEQALSLLYDRYAANIMGLALKMTQQREIAEELVQETFVRVWQRAKTFDQTRGNVAPWLFGIARNLSIDELRRRRVRPQPVYDDPENPWLAELPDETVSVEGDVWLREQRALIRSALRELSNDQREALELAYFSGLTQREIAERLGNPLGTIKTRMRLGLLKLREILGSIPGE
ncbi:MAG TPA: sigma-70 family RNA polymerase sigma factor [Herpetosiphonaceae bacterium]